MNRKHICDVNGDMLLAVVFGTQGKPGTVWFYTKQTGAALAELLKQATLGALADGSDTVAIDFDDVFGQNKSGE